MDIGRNHARPHFAEMRRERLSQTGRKLSAIVWPAAPAALAGDPLLGADDGARVEQAAEHILGRLAERRPAGVSTGGKLLRSISSAPIHCSSDWMRRLKPDCVTLRNSAAREKL